MKFVKICAFLLVISAALAAQMRREETGADWGDYTKTLRSRFAFVGKDVVVSKDKYDYGQWCRFDAKFASKGKAEGNFQFGIACDFSEGAPNANDKKYLTNLSGNVWYLPFRNIRPDNSNHYLNQKGYNRKLIYPFTADDGTELQVIVRFPYASMGNYIEASENKATAEGIDSMYPGPRARVKAYKNDMEAMSLRASQYQHVILEAKKGDAALKGVVESAKKQQVTLNEALKGAEAEFDTARQEYSKLKLKLTEQLHAVEVAQRKVQGISQEIDNHVANIAQIEKAKNNKAEVIKEYEAKQARYVSAVASLATRLKASTGSRPNAHVDAALASSKAFKQAEVTANLNKFQP